MTVQTIFEIIGSVSLLIIAILLGVVFYYLIKILRDISKVTHQFRERGKQFADLISTVIALIKKTVAERKKRK